MTKTITKPKKSTKKAEKNPVSKAAQGIFDKIQAKAGIDNKKIDKWQKKWITTPETRTKYKHLQDTPAVVGEELLAMTNDIIDFIQGQESGQSHVFAKLKKESKALASHPKDYLKDKFDKGKEIAKKASEKAKNIAKQAKAKAKDAKKIAEKTAKKAKKVAKG